MKKLHSLILALIITFLFFFFHSGKSNSEISILRVIDGDTIVLEGNITARLKNINCPEKNERGYNESVYFLKQFENEKLRVKFSGTDKYQRALVEIYSKDYINLLIVKEGLAKPFLVDSGERKIFQEAQKKAIESEKNIWKKSSYYGCFSSKIFPKDEIVFISNNCQTGLNLTIEDESRKKFNIFLSYGNTNVHSGFGFSNKTDIFLQSKENIWNNEGDTVYLFDSNRCIVHFNSY